MKVVFNGVKCELDAKLTSEEDRFIRRMSDNGFLMTYYPNEDKKTGSIEKVTLKLKNTILAKH